MTTSLILTTPEQHDFVDPTVERNPRRLQRWLDDLPLMNLLASAHQVIQALEPLNEQRVPPRERLDLLDAYRVTVRKLFMTGGPAGLGQLPMSKAERVQAITDLEQLCLALAGGYKVVVKALHRETGKQEDALLRSLQGAVEQLGLALVHSYRYHRPVPPFVFLELHQLYRLVRARGLLDAAADASGVNLSGHYHGTMLLALCDPFHLPDGMADLYHRTLLRYAALARIVPGAQWTGSGEGQCLLDLQSDSPPRLCVRLQAPVDADDPYLLDLQPAVAAMHRQLLGLSAEQRQQAPEASLLRILLPAAPQGDPRRSPRRSDGRWLEVLTGLQDIHDCLQRRERGAEAAAAAAHSLRVVDSSAEGMRLSWPDAALGDIQVGELLAVLSDSGEQLPRLQLGLVRWVRSERSGSTDLGVELLAGQASAVHCRPLDDATAAPWPCLFLPSRAGGSAGLLAPREIYQEGRRLLLQVGTREVRVRAARRVIETACIDGFEFASDSN
jgi:hypothetical protein